MTDAKEDVLQKLQVAETPCGTIGQIIGGVPEVAGDKGTKAYKEPSNVAVAIDAFIKFPSKMSKAFRPHLSTIPWMIDSE